ncbi:MAG TPA: hypothetical protein VF532_05355 [Candidatus Angelobacter sp.]
MENGPIPFNRQFQIMTYRCSHSQLLLRSGKTAQRPTRIDVLFKDVRAFELRTYLRDLTLEEINPAQLTGHAAQVQQVMEEGHKVYLLKADDWTGYIVAGALFWHEDEGEFGQPSVYMPEVTLLG